MALLMTQTDDARKQDDKEDRIPRLSKSDMVRQIPYDIEVSRYMCLKKPTSPETSCNDSESSRDIEFFTNVSIGGPEHSGLNTKKAREEGHSLKPKTKAIYLPLIDMPPAEYDHTVLTSMLQVKGLSEAAGQPFTLLTFDQQL